MSDGPLFVTFYWREMEQKTIGDHWQALSTQYLGIVKTNDIFQKYVYLKHVNLCFIWKDDTNISYSNLTRQALVLNK